ncbi:hypothetical protein E2C01_059630 [Portunus trituberculatus]|uniref:Uncharacterized protein n=1 Tax=Portunus trituberculatus TaxID=210409 RepID=A0A5B7H9K5_PORTR|nr:hypothetical protein [Portunus trituberculatus]
MSMPRPKLEVIGAAGQADRHPSADDREAVCWRRRSSEGSNQIFESISSCDGWGPPDWHWNSH